MASLSLDDLEQKRKDAWAVKRRFEPQWYLNLAFYNGKQWVKWDGQRIWEPPLEPWRLKLVDNRILPVIRTECAKMVKQRPRFVATPRTADDRDIQGSKYAETVLDFLWSELDLQRRHFTALLWSRICGAGFWKIYWDDRAGSAIDVLVDQNGDVLKNQMGRPIMADQLDPNLLPAEMAQNVQTKSLYQGEVCVEVRSPFEMGADPLASDQGLSGARWIVEDTVQSAEYVKERWGKTVSEDTNAMPGLLEARMPGIEDFSEGRTKGVRVSEFWAKPCPEYPSGKYCVWTKGEVLHDGDNPYPWLPYVMFRGVPSPGRFWPSSTVEHLISPQTELNKRKSQIAENASRIGNPPLLRPASMGEDFKWFGTPGEELVYQDFTGSESSIPRFMQVPELPGYVREDTDRHQQAIQEISGQHEVSAGQVPAGVTAASAINLLQEQDDTQLGPAIQEMEFAVGEAGTKIIELVNAYYDENRTIKIAGEEGNWDVFDFKATMLNGNTQIKVEAGSGMPRSKAAKQAAFQDTLNLILQYGIPVSQRNLRRFLRDYEVGGLERLFQDLEADENQVERENHKLFLVTLPVNEYDDHPFHIAAHQDFQKGARYEGWSDRAKANMTEHIQAHRDAMAAAAAAIAPLQNDLQPPGPDGSPQGNGGPPLPPAQTRQNAQNGPANGNGSPQAA